MSSDFPERPSGFDSLDSMVRAQTERGLDPYLRAGDVAKFLNVGIRTAYDLIKKHMKHLRIGGILRVRLSEVQAFSTRHETQMDQVEVIEDATT